MHPPFFMKGFRDDAFQCWDHRHRSANVDRNLKSVENNIATGKPLVQPTKSRTRLRAPRWTVARTRRDAMVHWITNGRGPGLL